MHCCLYSFDPDFRFGYPLHADVTGGKTKRAMNWEADKSTKMPIASERLMEYFDKNQIQTGKPLDP